jgi:hypothetical protein
MHIAIFGHGMGTGPAGDGVLQTSAGPESHTVRLVWWMLASWLCSSYLAEFDPFPSSLTFAGDLADSTARNELSSAMSTRCRPAVTLRVFLTRRTLSKKLSTTLCARISSRPA